MIRPSRRRGGVSAWQALSPDLLPATPEASEEEEQAFARERRCGLKWVAASSGVSPSGQDAASGVPSASAGPTEQELEARFPALRDIDTVEIRPTQDEWMPDKSVVQWADHIWQSVPVALRWWVETVEGADPVRRGGHPLQLLQKLLEQTPDGGRLEHVRRLFLSQGCPAPDLVILGSVDSVFHCFPVDFGRSEFRWNDDISPIERVLSVVDCFLTLVDSHPIPSVLSWETGITAVKKPRDWKAGGVHQVAALVCQVVRIG